MNMEENEKQQTPSIGEFFRSLTDPQKLEFIAQMFAGVSPDFLQTVINNIARDQAKAGGEVQLSISSDAKHVRLDFGRALAWFILTKEHAVQLGMLLLQHAGAEINKQQPPSGSPGELPPIDITPQ